MTKSTCFFYPLITLLPRDDLTRRLYSRHLYDNTKRLLVDGHALAFSLFALLCPNSCCQRAFLLHEQSHVPVSKTRNFGKNIPLVSRSFHCMRGRIASSVYPRPGGFVRSGRCCLSFRFYLFRSGLFLLGQNHCPCQFFRCRSFESVFAHLQNLQFKGWLFLFFQKLYACFTSCNSFTIVIKSFIHSLNCSIEFFIQFVESWRTYLVLGC